MKIEEIFPKNGANLNFAKKIRTIQKDKAKKNNPGGNDPQGGWNIDPHQGSFNRLRMSR